MIQGITISIEKLPALLVIYELSSLMLSMSEGEKYRREAMELSKKLGDSFIYEYKLYNEFVQKYRKSI